MKTIQVQTNITSISSRSDRSLRLSVVTPELSTEERLLYIDLQGLNLDTYFKPLDYKTENIKIDKEVGEKSPSKRLRDRMWVYYNQRFPDLNDFEGWYRNQLEKIGQNYLDKLD